MDISEARQAYILLVRDYKQHPIGAAFNHSVSKPLIPPDPPFSNLTILDHAAAGNLSLVQDTISRYPECINLENSGMTPLFYACDGGHADVVEYLISQGANVNHSDSIGQTALHVAAIVEGSGNGIVYKLLLCAGGDEMVRDIDGKCPSDYF